MNTDPSAANESKKKTTTMVDPKGQEEVFPLGTTVLQYFKIDSMRAPRLSSSVTARFEGFPRLVLSKDAGKPLHLLLLAIVLHVRLSSLF